MKTRPSNAPPAPAASPRPFWGPAILWGGLTACVLGLLLMVLATWYRDHLWLVWESRSLGLFYLIAGLVTVLPATVVGLLLDRQRRLHITLHQRGEEIDTARAELLRTNRALTALGAVNHALLRAADRQSFLSTVCQILVEKSGYSLVWVGMIESGSDKHVQVTARAGEDAGLLDNLHIRHDDSPRGQGPTGTAIREDRIVLIPRFQDAPFYQHWPDKPSLLDGYTSGIAFPLHANGRVTGALTIYEQREREFGLEERDLLRQMSEDVTYGLHFLHLSTSRERTARLLRQSLRASNAMVATARGLVSGPTDLREAASLVLSRAMAVTESPFGALGVTDRRTGRIDWLVSSGPDGTLEIRRSPECELYPDDAGRFDGPFAQALNEGRIVRQNTPVSLEGYLPCPPSQNLIQRILAVPLRRAGQSPDGILLLAAAPSLYQERDARAVQRLAVLFDMGAARLQVEEELVAAKRRAEAASEAKTQFLANISHELRTPINGILGMAQLAILEGATGREAEYWQTVRESTDRLVEIVDNLLELASVESGSLSPLLREFSLRRLLESLRGAFSVRAGLAGLTLELDIAPELPDKLLGDPFRLRQILANLLGNAIRFTPTGGISMLVRAFDHKAPENANRVFVSQDFSGLCLAFSVTDTGIGIPEDKQAAIFESFTLGEDYLTKRFGGTGMGLSIATRMAELLGGGIAVESRPGFGSTFTLTVPLWPVVTPPQDTAPAPAPIKLPPLRFLVVEDEAVNRLALARSLRKLGHTVLEAGNGEEALRRLAQEQVDVVIMDVQMPVMDGLMALGHIRNGEVPGTNRHLPVVALTAYALEGDRKRFLDAGMDEFVTKPCDMQQLLHAVAKVLGREATCCAHP